MSALLRARYLSVIAVVFSVIGAAAMFVVGAVTTVKAIGKYFGLDEAEAFSSEASLKTTIELVSALDQFLLALVLFIFAYGVLSLFVFAGAAQDLSGSDKRALPDWFGITSVTDLKIKLLETIAILLAVLFLKGALEVVENPVRWEDLVIPLAVGIFGATIWLIKRSHNTRAISTAGSPPHAREVT